LLLQVGYEVAAPTRPVTRRGVAAAAADSAAEEHNKARIARAVRASVGGGKTRGVGSDGKAADMSLQL